MNLTRRQTLQAATVIGLNGLALRGFPAAAQAPTPACGDAHPTTESAEGPFYKPSSPLRTSLMEQGISGRRLVITGRVTSLNCMPVAKALLDFWQADTGGHYDNGGFHLRGHQFTDDAGNYRLESILPGLYPGRTRHIHVKVASPGREILTTQLYFPGEAVNARDGYFRSDLVIALAGSGDSGRFDFVLNFT